METSLTTSAMSRDTLPAQAAGAGSHKPMSRRRWPWLVAPIVNDVHSQRSIQPCHITTVLPTKHLFGHTRTMMSYTNSPRVREAGSLSILPVTTIRTTSPRRHPRIQASPLRRL
jgi:hypothetical protein